MKIRSWDNVKVITWKDKWTTGKVIKAFPSTNKVLVEKVHVVKRHYKKQWTQAGQIIEKELPIDVSNVMLVCPHTDKPTRVWFVMVGEKKFRYSKKAVSEGKKPTDAIIK